MLPLARPLVGLHRSDSGCRALREVPVVIASGEAVPFTPSSMPPTRPPASTRLRSLSVPARLGACPRRATTCPHALEPADPRRPPGGSLLSVCLVYAPAGLWAGHDGLAPRSNERHAPSRAPQAERLSRSVPPPGGAACVWAGVSRRRTAPKALPPRPAGPPG